MDIQKVTKGKDRMVTFSKRKNGIYSKLSKLSILCSVDVGFLVYSGVGEPFTFGSPSFDVVAHQFLHGNHPSRIINGEGNSSPTSMIVDAHKKMKVDKYCKILNNLLEIKTEAEEEKLKMSEAACASSLPVKNTDASRKVDPKEKAKQLLRRYEEYYEELCEIAAAKVRGRYDVSTSSSHPPHG